MSNSTITLSAQPSILHLPNEVLENIFGYLKIEDFRAFSCANKQLQDVALQASKQQISHAIQDLTQKINEHLSLSLEEILNRIICPEIIQHFNNPELSQEEGITQMGQQAYVVYRLVDALHKLNLSGPMYGIRDEGEANELIEMMQQVNEGEEDFEKLIAFLQRCYQRSKNETPTPLFFQTYQSYQREKNQKQFTQILQDNQKKWLSDIEQIDSLVKVEKTACFISWIIIPFMQRLSEKEQKEIYTSLTEKYPFANNFLKYLSTDYNIIEEKEALIEELVCKDSDAEEIDALIDTHKELAQEEYQALCDCKAKYTAIHSAKRGNFERAKEEVKKISNPFHLSNTYHYIARIAAEKQHPEIAIEILSMTSNFTVNYDYRSGSPLPFACRKVKETFENQGLTEAAKKVEEILQQFHF